MYYLFSYLNTKILFPIACLIFLSLNTFAQEGQPNFIHLTPNDGLSHSHVNAILKDKNGFMWFATDEGLNKYDAYTFSVFKHISGKTTSLSNNIVTDLHEDEHGDLWVSTTNGLNKFNRENNTFVKYPQTSGLYVRDIFQDTKERLWLSTSEGFYIYDIDENSIKEYKHSQKDTNSLIDNLVYEIMEDDGEFWIATKGGLDKFNPEKHQFTHYKHDPDNPKSVGGNHVKSVYKDSEGRIWAGFRGGGITLYNKIDSSFTNFRHDPNNKNSLSYNDILSFEEDDQGRLWIGTENGGISILDHKKNSFITYKNDITNQNSLNNNSIYAMYRDDIGNMWVGTWSGGINFLPKFGHKFKLYRHIPTNPNSLSMNIVLSVGGDSDDNIWIGTDGGGLNHFNRKTRKFTRHRANINDSNTISTDYILSTLEIRKDLLALGYHRGGLDFFDLHTGNITHHLPDENNPGSLSSYNISSIMKDQGGNIWLGTADSGGLNMYDTLTKTFTHFKLDYAHQKNIRDGYVYCMIEDKEKNMWVGTDNGIVLFDRETQKHKFYSHDPANHHSLSHNIVQTILEDHSGNLWVGTMGGGLNFFDKEKKIFTAYKEKDGLPNNTIYGILEDDHGNIWFSSNKGISKFNPKTKQCRNYNISDGLQDNSFKSATCFKASDGEMFFGGVNGLNSFYPDSIVDNPYIPEVYITDFQIYNRSADFGQEGSPLNEAISETKEITLSHAQSVITFGFSSLNYTFPEKNLHAYKLDGFDKEWTHVGSKRTATYTNLNPGNYNFMVKASNNDGLWNEKGTSLSLIITPPWWQTWWFISLSAVLILIGLISSVRIRTGVINKQKLFLEQQVQERTQQLANLTKEERAARLEAEKSGKEAEKANQAKSIFLATMSHEIRTPMNGVIGMASLLKETNLNVEQKEYTETIFNCGETLLTVINDILDFSKIESGKIELEAFDFNLRKSIEDVLSLFAAKAATARIDLLLQMDDNVPSQVISDGHRLKQILTNLIGNAIKFTERGEIFIGVKVLNRIGSNFRLKFEVRDTGIGIPDDKLNKLFKAFSQVDSSTTRKYGGTGLGLVICEKLVHLMGGTIQVQSQQRQGTTFTFDITVTGVAASNEDPLNLNITSLNGKRILVVANNSTNKNILKAQLESWNFSPILVDSGKKAIVSLSKRDAYDLVITELHMPGMDGQEFAIKVKKDFPQLQVILLIFPGDDYNLTQKDVFGAILTKPVRQKELYDHVIDALQSSVKKPVIENIASKNTLSINFAKIHPLSILVAEDNLVNQRLALIILEKLGYDAEIASDGKEVLKAVYQKHYDVVLMDIQMPELDGLEATREIRKSFHYQPVVIAVTANAMQGDIEICIASGMDDYLSKPIRLNELMEKLKYWSDNKGNR